MIDCWVRACTDVLVWFKSRKYPCRHDVIQKIIYSTFYFRSNIKRQEMRAHQANGSIDKLARMHYVLFISRLYGRLIYTCARCATTGIFF